MTKELDEINKVWQQSELIYSIDEVKWAITGMANEINELLAGKNPIVICVMTGGAVVFSELLTQLNMPLQIDYVHVERYRGETIGGSLNWLRSPTIDVSGRTVLFVDGIIDEGITLNGIMEQAKTRGASEVHGAVLLDKLKEDTMFAGNSPSFFGLTCPDRFVFGYGLDYKGYLRNVAGIYAVKEDEGGK